MEIRTFQKGDEKAILGLFEIAFSKRMTYDYWNWRFANNPFDSRVFIDLMWEDNKLVGHYAVSPVDMIIRGEVFNTALSMTTMTHPDYVGKGIFTQLYNSMYQKLSQNDFKMIWGFPNKNSHYGFIKNLGWKDLAVQGMMSLNKNNIESKINRSVNYSFVERFTDLIKEQLNNSEKGIKIDKSISYLQWRYFENPSAEYKVIQLDNKEGVIIYKCFMSFDNPLVNEIDILDCYFADNSELLVELLSAIFDAEEKVEKINCWVPLESKSQLVLERTRFSLSPPLIYFGCKPLRKSDYILNYNNWDIELSYSDVF